MRMAKKPLKITIFNHKGGVGKTTLAVNIAAALNEMGKRVLLVDSDPQSNLSAYMMEESLVDDLMDHSESRDGRTLWTAMKPLTDLAGDYHVIKPVEVKGIYLLPGDIRLSLFEVQLYEFWNDCVRRYPKGYRATTALSRLILHVCESEKIDFVFYDTGPNIGPLNRAILLDCDYFVVPAACDLFSVRALKTLGRALIGWVKDWHILAELAPTKLPILQGSPQFLGYIPQHFRTYGGAMSTVDQQFFVRFKRQLQKDLIDELKSADMNLVAPDTRSAKLGEVKDFSSLVRLSQQQGLPLWKVSGGNSDQKENAKRAFHEIAQNVVTKTSQIHAHV
jgi:cellulose biosynthesis protein BcsQ